MPKTIKLAPHLSSEELENHYRKAHDRVLRSHYQILWLISLGKTTTQVMEATGYSRGWIQQIARRYNSDGPEALGDRRHGNPGATDRALLDAEQVYGSEAAPGLPVDVRTGGRDDRTRRRARAQVSGGRLLPDTTGRAAHPRGTGIHHYPLRTPRRLLQPGAGVQLRRPLRDGGRLW